MRAISLPLHSALEVIAAPAIMVAPFALGFNTLASAFAVAFGALLLGLAVQIGGSSRSLPPSAHQGFDYVLATVALAGGLAIGVVTGEWAAGVFLVGVGVAQVMLTASTRFSLARGA